EVRGDESARARAGHVHPAVVAAFRESEERPDESDALYAPALEDPVCLVELHLRPAPSLEDYGRPHARDRRAPHRAAPRRRVAPGAGSDGLVDCLTQATLDPGDEIVCGWPSFPSYVIDARKLGAVPRTVPLRDGRYDLDAMLEAIGSRTKLVYVCHPNNPTGTTNTREELDAYFDCVPPQLLTGRH